MSKDLFYSDLLSQYLKEWIKKYYPSRPDLSTRKKQSRSATNKITPPFPLEKEISDQFTHRLGLAFFLREPEEGKVCFAQSAEVREDFRTYFTSSHVCDYGLAVVHSSAFRKIRKALSKTVPIPLPSDTDRFWHLVNLGTKLRQAMTSKDHKSVVGIAVFPHTGSNKITKNQFLFKPDTNSHTVSFLPKYAKNNRADRGRVDINDHQFFDRIPLWVWEYKVGGLQPARDWLKNAAYQVLTPESIQSYQNLIIRLNNIHPLIEKIDEIIEAEAFMD